MGHDTVDRVADRGRLRGCFRGALVLGGAAYADRPAEHRGQRSQPSHRLPPPSGADPRRSEAAAVLYRSESIYCQAVDNYNHALHRPWVYIPARIMGFHRAPEEPESGPWTGIPRRVTRREPIRI